MSSNIVVFNFEFNFEIELITKDGQFIEARLCF